MDPGPEPLQATAATQCPGWACLKLLPGASLQEHCARMPGDELAADVVWLATGRCYDALADPVLAGLQACAATASRVLGGYPELARPAAPGPKAPAPPPAWPGLPLFVLGRAALLAVGPGAGVRSEPCTWLHVHALRGT